MHRGALILRWQGSLREGTALLWFFAIFPFTAQLRGPRQFISLSPIPFYHLGNRVSDHRGAHGDSMTPVGGTHRSSELWEKPCKNASSLGIMRAVHQPF